MFYKIALILSVILQVGAAVIALTLVRRTRTNIAWWLISAGFVLMAVRRVVEITEVYNAELKPVTEMLASWTGVLISLIMLLSLIFIKRIFNIQQQMDDLRAQNESRVLSAILRTEEKERQHFAKELHDGLGPLLSSVKMSISTIQPESIPRPPVITITEYLIDESISTLKEISNRLSPHVLTNFGLYRAIRSFIGKLRIPDQPQIHFRSNLEDRRFSFNLEVVLYRIVCELISNALKHSKSKNIHIGLVASEHYLDLKYIDDGIGFDPSVLEREHAGLGLSSIRSRIKSLGGSCHIDTEPGKGVRITTRVRID